MLTGWSTAAAGRRAGKCMRLWVEKRTDIIYDFIKSFV